MNDIRELQQYFNRSNPGNINSISDHPLITILDGHPLSIVIVSSLRKNMSLIEIYELLELIKGNYKNQILEPSTLAMTLSTEVSLMLIKRQNMLAYNALMCFALCPSGLSRSE